MGAETIAAVKLGAAIVGAIGAVGTGVSTAHNAAMQRKTQASAAAAQRNAALHNVAVETSSGETQADTSNAEKNSELAQQNAAARRRKNGMISTLNDRQLTSSLLGGMSGGTMGGKNILGG